MCLPGGVPTGVLLGAFPSVRSKECAVSLPACLITTPVVLPLRVFPFHRRVGPPNVGQFLIFPRARWRGEDYRY